jgi:hypothetical protein
MPGLGFSFSVGSMSSRVYTAQVPIPVGIGIVYCTVGASQALPVLYRTVSVLYSVQYNPQLPLPQGKVLYRTPPRSAQSFNFKFNFNLKLENVNYKSTDKEVYGTC